MITFEIMHAIDWPDVKRIYEQGIRTGDATFETSTPSWEMWDNTHLKHSRLVAKRNDSILGWAALTPVSGRCVYAGVAEVSVYIGSHARGIGVGKQILEKLIIESEGNGLWTLQAGIFPENICSIAAHERNGFRKIGLRKKIGKLNGVWRDTLLFERRSVVIGID